MFHHPSGAGSARHCSPRCRTRGWPRSRRRLSRDTATSTTPRSSVARFRGSRRPPPPRKAERQQLGGGRSSHGQTKKTQTTNTAMKPVMTTLNHTLVFTATLLAPALAPGRTQSPLHLKPRRGTDARMAWWHEANFGMFIPAVIWFDTPRNMTPAYARNLRRSCGASGRRPSSTAGFQPFHKDHQCQPGFRHHTAVQRAVRYQAIKGTHTVTAEITADDGSPVTGNAYTFDVFTAGQLAVPKPRIAVLDPRIR